MIITHKIKMDLCRRRIVPPVTVVQDDKYSRNLELTMTCGDAPWSPPAGTDVAVSYRKADGTGGKYNALPDGTIAGTVVNNVVTVALAPQVCTAPGLVRLVVGLVNGQQELHSFVIEIVVQSNPGIDVAESEDYEKLQVYPCFADAIAGCIDKTKLYVLPDGFLYAYIEGHEAEPLFVNQLPISTDPDGGVYNGVGYKAGVRWSVRNAVEEPFDGCYLSGLIPVKMGDIVRLRNVGLESMSEYDDKSNCIVFIPSGGSATPWSMTPDALDGENYDCDWDSDSRLIKFKSPCGGYLRTNAFYLGPDSIITVNQEIAWSGKTETGWQNTGHAFVPADYEQRIVSLERALLTDMHIYGIVDQDNTIYVTGALARGTYTLKFQYDDGSTLDIGTFTV